MQPELADSAIGFIGVAEMLRVRMKAVELASPDSAIVRLPLSHLRDAQDLELVSSFASACNLVFVDLPGDSVPAALPAILRTGTSAIVDLPSGISLRELRSVLKLAEEANATVAVSRPLRYQEGFAHLRAAGRCELVWADLHASSNDTKRMVLSDYVDLIVDLVEGRGVQRIDSKRVLGVSGVETFGISIRFQNSALAMIRLRIGIEPERTHSIVRTSGNSGDAEAMFTGRPYDIALVADETREIVETFLSSASLPNTLAGALGVNRIVEQILARMRQHDSLAI